LGDLESAPVILGGAVGYALNTRWAIEGELSFMPDASQGQIVEFDTSLWSLSANVLYHFTGRRTTPYVTAGLGVVSADAELEETGLVEDDTSTKFAWNRGAVKSALNHRLGIRGDFRYVTGDELVPDHRRLYGGLIIRRIGRSTGASDGPPPVNRQRFNSLLDREAGVRPAI
jgi:opacity protein-like surface antigen